MKLLSWIHRKLQKDHTGSFKGSAIGSSFLLLKPSPNTQEDYARPGDKSKLRQQAENQTQHYLKEFKATQTAEINEKESTEIFPGFLTIGTLSVDPITEPATPTFNVAQEETNVDGIPEMKYDLKLINDELEKFLRAEAGKEGNNESSYRNSNDSNVSLIGKEEEGEYEIVTIQPYPLQGYLLWSSTQLLDTKQKGKKEKTSLQVIFQKNRIAPRSRDKKAKETQKQTKKEVKSSNHLMKKTLKKHQPSCKNSTSSTGCAAESSPIATKLNKIKQLFHKKIHPEVNTATKDPNKFTKHDSKKILRNSGYCYPASALSYENNWKGCWGTLMKEENHGSMADMNLSQDAKTVKKTNAPSKEISGGAGREHWINTDEDYLVLELQQIEEPHF